MPSRLARLEAGANPNVYTPCSKGGVTALILTCQMGNRDTARALIQYGANLREQRPEAMRVAKENGHKRIVTLLQSYDAGYPKHSEETAQQEREQRKREWLGGNPLFPSCDTSVSDGQTDDEPKPFSQGPVGTEALDEENDKIHTVHSVSVETIDSDSESEASQYKPAADTCWLFPVQEQGARKPTENAELLDQVSATSETQEETNSIDDDLIEPPTNSTQFYDDGYDC